MRHAALLELPVTVIGVPLTDAVLSAAEKKENLLAASASSMVTHVPSLDAANKPYHDAIGMTIPSAQNITALDETAAYEISFPLLF
jgi:hypothetical protein